MNNKYYVYLYKRKDNNNVFYIGKGCNNRDISIAGHNQYCRNIANKYGCIIERIYENLTEKEALELEEKTINHYITNLGYSIALDNDSELRNRNNDKFLCNHTLGGDGSKGSHRMSDKERKKRSDKWKGNNNIAKRADVREKISQYAKQYNNYAQPKVIEKISKKRSETLNKPEVKEKRSKFYKEFYKTEKGKESIRKANQTKKMKGYKPYNAKKIYCLETNKIYDSYTDFQNVHGINRHKLKKLFEEQQGEYIEVMDKTNNLTLHIKISI